MKHAIQCKFGVAILALSTLLLPRYGGTELSAEAILTDMTDSAGRWMTGPLKDAPHIGWAAINSGYIVSDSELETTLLGEGEYYILLETTPENRENIYPLEGNKVRKEFDIQDVPKKDGFYIYQVKKCGIYGCDFIGHPLLVLHYILTVN